MGGGGQRKSSRGGACSVGSECVRWWIGERTKQGRIKRRSDYRHIGSGRNPDYDDPGIVVMTGTEIQRWHSSYARRSNANTGNNRIANRGQSASDGLPLPNS
jgi:hypothetical protein